MPNGNDVVGAVNNLVTAFDSYTTPRDHMKSPEASAKVTTN